MLNEFMTIARSEIGVKEIPGKASNSRIIEYAKDLGWGAWYSDDSIPWCSVFANWVVKKAGYKPSGSAAARSWLEWGKAVKNPVPGCIVVFKRGNSNWQGHVAFYVGEGSNGYIRVLGGNQSDQVNIANYAKSSILGYRVPATYDVADDEDGNVVMVLQKALNEKKYHVGKEDGIMGPITRDAIMAFEADHNLPITGKPTLALVRLVKEAEPRVISTRMAATSEDIPDDGTGAVTKIVKGATMGGVGLVGANSLSDVASNLGYLQNIAQTYKSLMISVGPWLPIVVIVVGGAVWYYLDRVKKKKLEDYKTNRLT